MARPAVQDWPEIVADREEDIAELRELLEQFLCHPLIAVGIEDDENADLLRLVKETRRTLGQGETDGK